MAGEIDLSPESEPKLKVFISYSRAQVHFADDVEFVLSEKGFDVLIDRRDIPRGHPDFFSHLEEMILSCDTVVFILSDESAVSDACEWEISKANSLNRRVLAITLADLSEGVVSPPGLAGIDWIHCWRNPKIPGSSEAKGFAELAIALRTNIDWLRQQTRLQQRAAQHAANPVEALLMRGEELELALAWAQSASSGQPVSKSLSTYISASEQAEADRSAIAQAGLAEREAALERARIASARVRRVALIGAVVSSLLLITTLTIMYLAWILMDPLMCFDGRF